MVEKLKQNKKDIYISTILIIFVLVISRNAIYNDGSFNFITLLLMVSVALGLKYFVVTLIHIEKQSPSIGNPIFPKNPLKGKKISKDSIKDFLVSRPKIDYFIYLLILIGISFTLRNLYEYFQVNTWRGDSIYYLKSYYGKVGREGRWINLIFFIVLKFIPSIISITVHYFAIGFFTYKCAENITHDSKLSLMTSLIAVNMTPLSSQLTWPVTSLPAFLFLAITPFLYKKFTKWSFFAITSVVFFGTFSNYYFILPLLLLGEILEYTKNHKFLESCTYVIKELLLPWIVCFVVGYIVANLVTSALHGHFIEFADWRQPHKVDSFAQLLENIGRAVDYFVTDLLIMTESLGNLLLLLILLLSLVSFSIKNYMYLAICGLVILSVYVSTIFDGIVIDHRTVVPAVMGFVFIFTLPKFKYSKKYIPNLILSLGIVISFNITSYSEIHWFRVTTDAFEYELQKGDLELDPDNYNKVIILAENSDVAYFEWMLGETTGVKKPDWDTSLGTLDRAIFPQLQELGFKSRNIIVTPEDYYFEKTYEENNIIIKKVDDNNNLVIYFNEAGYDSWE